MGTAEYMIADDHVYVQGVCVHPQYRGHGVCRSLILAVAEIARTVDLKAIAIHVIEETGNVAIFERLGFKVTSRAVAPDCVGPAESPVTLVKMERGIP